VGETDTQRSTNLTLHKHLKELVVERRMVHYDVFGDEGGHYYLAVLQTGEVRQIRSLVVHA